MIESHPSFAKVSLQRKESQPHTLFGMDNPVSQSVVLAVSRTDREITLDGDLYPITSKVCVVELSLGQLGALLSGLTVPATLLEDDKGRIQGPLERKRSGQTKLEYRELLEGALGELKVVVEAFIKRTDDYELIARLTNTLRIFKESGTHLLGLFEKAINQQGDLS